MPVHQFDVVIERDEDGWLVASVPALPGCHTQARSQDELLTRIKEAIGAYLEARGDPPARTEFVGVQRVEVET
jgi:predicted RNase H-like HicB family nuclease